MKFSHLVFFIIIALSPLVSKAAPQRPAIIMFGDSITLGYPSILLAEYETQGPISSLTTSPEGASFGPSVDELSKLLSQSQRASTVLNWGKGGTSSQEGVNRIDNAINSAKNSYSSENYFILLHYGTNDFGKGILTSETGFNTRVMIDKAKSKGVTPIVGNLLPRDDRSVSSYNSNIASAASSKSVPLVNFYNAFVYNPFDLHYTALLENELLAGKYKHLHPTLEGYQYLASIWLNQALINLIEQRVSIAPIYLLLNN